MRGSAAKVGARAVQDGIFRCCSCHTTLFCCSTANDVVRLALAAGLLLVKLLLLHSEVQVYQLSALDHVQRALQPSSATADKISSKKEKKKGKNSRPAAAKPTGTVSAGAVQNAVSP